MINIVTVTSTDRTAGNEIITVLKKRIRTCRRF